MDWRISQEKKQTYINIFNSLKPSDGKLSGNQVKSHMMNSKLHVAILTKIWDLSDIDLDGLLNLREFVIVSILLLLLEIKLIFIFFI